MRSHGLYLAVIGILVAAGVAVSLLFGSVSPVSREIITTSYAALTDQALPANADVVVARQTGKHIVVVGMTLSAYADTYVTFFDDAATISHNIFVLGGDNPTLPINEAGWFESSDGNTLKVKSNGGTGGITVRWVAR